MDKIKPMPQEVLIKIAGQCALCGGTYSAGQVGEPPSPALFHSLPACEPFQKLNPSDFLQAVHKEMLRLTIKSHLASILS